MVYEVYELALEVADGDVEVLARDVHSYEEAGVGVEAEDGRPAASGCALLAKVLEEALVDQFVDQLGHRGYAGIDT